MGIIKFTKVEQAWRLILFYKIIHNLTPEYTSLRADFTFAEEDGKGKSKLKSARRLEYTRAPKPPLHQSQYCFRNQDVIGEVRARTEKFESSFCPNCLSE